MPPPREQPRSVPPKWWMFVVAGVCHSLFMALAFPPAGVWVLAVFAPVPLIWAGCRAGPRIKLNGFFTALGVLPLWVYEQAWLWNVTQVGYPLLAIYMSVYAGVFVWLFALTRRWWTPKGRAGPLLGAFVVAPVIWTALEVVRGEVILTGYPWYLAGHPLIEAPILAAPGSVFGAYFVSFLLVALGGALADAAGWMGVSRGMGGVGAGVVLGVWGTTAIVGGGLAGGTGAGTGNGAAGSESEGRVVRIGVVQTNVPQDNKLGWKVEDRIEDWRAFAKLTRDAAATRPRPDLIVWPETMYPGESLNREYREKVTAFLEAKGQDPARTPATMFTEPLLALQVEIGVPLLIGAESLEGVTFTKDEAGNDIPSHEGRFNSAFLIEGGAIREERYDKIERTPFGEMIPYVWRWPRLQRFVENAGAGGMTFDLTAGSEAHVFTLETGGAGAAGVTAIEAGGRERAAFRFVTPICFEATKPELCRRLVYEGGRRRADLIINISNDGWFGPTHGWRMLISGGRRQHLLAARWRCVELGVPMVRAVNTGISAHIDRTGKIRRAGPDGRDSPVNTSGMMVATAPIPQADFGTVFGRIGNIFGWVMVGMAACLPWLGLAVRGRRPNRTNGAL